MRRSNWVEGEYQGATRAGGGKTYIADIDAADANDLGSGPDKGDLLRGGLGLFDAASDDAGICAEMDEGAGLGTADGTSSAGDEEDAVGCEGVSLWGL